MKWHEMKKWNEWNEKKERNETAWNEMKWSELTWNANENENEKEIKKKMKKWKENEIEMKWNEWKDIYLFETEISLGGWNEPKIRNQLKPNPPRHLQIKTKVSNSHIAQETVGDTNSNKACS